MKPSLAAVFLAVSVAISEGTPEETSLWMASRAAGGREAAPLKHDGFAPMPRIIGGTLASYREFRWMSAIVRAGEPARIGHFAGGALVHPLWVVTSARRVAGLLPREIEVLNDASELSPTSGTRRQVAEIIVHPDFNPVTMDSDIALLRLTQPESTAIDPLPVIDDPALAAPGTVATILGWGSLADVTGAAPRSLRKLAVPLIDLAAANANKAYAGTLTANMLAAGFPKERSSPCLGDEGGPLIVPSPVAPGWMLAGITSFGAGCALPGVPWIHTRAESFRDFITAHIRPRYAAWEKANGRVGEARDPDGNGLGNLQDFGTPAYFDRAVSGDRFLLSYPRLEDESELTYYLESRARDTSWRSANASLLLPTEPLGDGMVLWKHSFSLLEQDKEFRLLAYPATGFLATGPRALACPGSAEGALDAADPEHPALPGHRAKHYRLDGLVPGTVYSVSLRAPLIDSRLELIDLASGAVLQTATSDAGFGRLWHDELLTFTAVEGARHGLRVTTEAAGQTGSYEVAVWIPQKLATLPALPADGSPTTGSLATSDPYDPNFQPGGEFFHDDYLLDIFPGYARFGKELRMRSTGATAWGIDDSLSLIDGETGRLVSVNDNFVGKSNDAGLRFFPVPGKPYIVRASSAVRRDIGRYTITMIEPPLGFESPLAVVHPGHTPSAHLTATSELDESRGTFKRDFLLDRVSGGETVTVTLTSRKFDAYLMILDAADLTVIHQADTGGPASGRGDARVQFVFQPERQYLIRATTRSPREKGAYTLIVDSGPP